MKCLTQELEIHTARITKRLPAALFVKAKDWKQPISVGERVRADSVNSGMSP